MKKPTIEQLFIAARPEANVRHDFVAATMDSVRSSRNPEIISDVMRRMDEPQTKGWSFMKKLQTLPLGAAVLLALGSALVLGGAAYATYKLLWEPLTIEQSSVTTEGDKNRVAFDLSGCSGVNGTPESRAMIESRIDSGVSPDEAEKYVGAYCERNRIHQYGYKLVGAETDQAKAASGIWLDYEPVLYSEVPKGELGNVHKLTDTTQFIVAGEERTAAEFADSDLVFRIMKYETDGEDAYTDATVLAIAKASYDAEFYDSYTASLKGLVHAIPCRNNASELCINGPGGSPIYKALPDTAGPEYQPSPFEQRILDSMEKRSTTQFEGSIVGITGDTLTIKTSSGRLMKVELPLGTIAKAVSIYGETGMTFGLGNTLHVLSISEKRDTLTTEDLVGVYFL